MAADQRAGGARQIFVPGVGQYENIGDIILRRELIAWLQPLGGLHVYVGPSPEGYAESLGLGPDAVLYRSFGAYYTAALKQAWAGRADYVFKPGEIQLTLVGMKEHLSVLPMLLAIRARLGRVARVGSGARNFAPLPRLLITPSILLSQLVAWRDPKTAAYLRRGESGLHPMLVSAYQPFSVASEAFRMLRSQLMLRWFNHGHKILAIGGPRTGSGASTLVANLAISFSQLGERTLLLDANFRRPAQHSLFGLSAEVGLADVLLGRSSVEKAIVTIAQLNGLAVLCAGPMPPNPHELLSSRALQYLLDLAREIYDIVILDTPPVLGYADAQMIAARANGYLLVTRRHRTRLNDVSAVQERLAPTGATLLGAVVNDE